jgi:hypothetical protein
MAILLTEEYIPSNVYIGGAVAKTEDNYEIAQPFIDFISGTKSNIQKLKSWIKSTVIKTQSWLQYGNKNPLDWLAAGVDSILTKADYYKRTFFGRNLSGWAKDDPVAWGCGVGATIGTAFLIGGLVLSSPVLGAVAAAGAAAYAGFTMLSGGVKGLVQAAKIAVKGLNFIPGIGGLVRWAVGGVQRLWSFNWNQTDAQIRANQTQQIKALAGRWGEALGATVGTLCGFTLGRAAKANAPRLMRFNPLLLAKLKELEFRSWAEPGELWEEAVEEVKSTLVASGRAIVAVVFMETYVNVRKLIKSFVKYSGLGTVFPWLGKASEQWGKEGSQPWSFASQQEKSIESIKIDWLKDFTEEFVEATQDMCAESTIIASYAL